MEYIKVPKDIMLEFFTYVSSTRHYTGMDKELIDWINKLQQKSEPLLNDNQKIRTFDGGATRDSDQDKLDYEGFLSPIVIKRYAEYLHKHRLQSDGQMRDSDNWQKGMPKDVYIKSLWRHLMDMWSEHRGLKSRDGIEDAICGVMFNSMGYLFETLKNKKEQIIDNERYTKDFINDYKRRCINRTLPILCEWLCSCGTIYDAGRETKCPSCGKTLSGGAPVSPEKQQ